MRGAVIDALRYDRTVMSSIGVNAEWVLVQKGLTLELPAAGLIEWPASVRPRAVLVFATVFRTEAVAYPFAIIRAAELPAGRLGHDGLRACGLRVRWMRRSVTGPLPR